VDPAFLWWLSFSKIASNFKPFYFAAPFCETASSTFIISPVLVLEQFAAVRFIAGVLSEILFWANTSNLLPQATAYPLISWVVSWIFVSEEQQILQVFYGLLSVANSLVGIIFKGFPFLREARFFHINLTICDTVILWVKRKISQQLVEL